MSNGKGSKRRPTNEKAYAENHERIHWRRQKCVCGATNQTIVAINNEVLYKCRECGRTT